MLHAKTMLISLTLGATSLAAAQMAAPKVDENFMKAATMSNLAEIVTSKLALQKSDDASVKAFAQQMIDDHTKAQNELAQFAKQKGVMLPDMPGADQQVMAAKLEGLSGPAFDMEYKNVQVMGHQNTVALLTTYRSIGKENDVTQYAAKIQPIVEMHLMEAKQLP